MTGLKFTRTLIVFKIFFNIVICLLHLFTQLQNFYQSIFYSITYNFFQLNFLELHLLNMIDDFNNISLKPVANLLTLGITTELFKITSSISFMLLGLCSK